MLVVELKNKMNMFPYVKQTSLTTSNNMRKSSIYETDEEGDSSGKWE